ncbi:MAG: hypothetical protein LBL63_03135, partial [Clostridiales Family XIII bacterium]|nr:hypothetical protein [Clostridiales Family XIII bacterium]
MSRKPAMALAMVLAIILALGGYSYVPGIYASETGAYGVPGEDTAWYLPDADLLEISSADGLTGLAAIVGGAADGVARDDFAGKTVILTEDIDLGGREWTPIGDYGKDFAFAGAFEGNGNTISGLSIATGSNVGLFGYLTGEIRNLAVEGAVSGDECVAGVVAKLAGAMRHVTNRVTVSATGSYVGGVSADAAGDFLIADCRNEGSVTNYSNTQSSGKLGGILGRADTGRNGVIERCANAASITGYQYLGGIAGGVFGEVSIRTSFNLGKIEGKSFGKIYLGGIAGKLESGTIDSCYNRGDIHGDRANQTMGHIRAVGGIVGCEENHAVGTAVTNVYQTGSIALNTEGMDRAADNHYIMMTGHISGGNSSTDANTMMYEDCFYERGCYPQAEPGHPDFAFFRHDEGIALWDTPYVTAATGDELRGADVLAALGGAFVADTEGVNEGYPILAWQNDGTPPPTLLYEVREPIVLGGTATISVSPRLAPEGETITVEANAVEAGKRVYLVRATDAAGAEIPVALDGDGAYVFAMPARPVNVKVILENDVSGGERHSLSIPADLDAIWTVWTESRGAVSQGSGVAAGATVFVGVRKDPDARASTLLGIEARTGAGDILPVETLEEGFFAFTMPDEGAAISLDIAYATLTVRSQIEESGTPQELRVYGRAEMEALARTDIYYSGWSSEIDPMVGRADTAVPLADLLADAGVAFEPGDILRIGSLDGMSMSYPYETLIGTPRYFYPSIFEESEAGRAAFAPILTIRQNVALRSSGTGAEPAEGDTLNAYRFIFGQSEEEFVNHTKIVDRLPKYVTSVTVVKPLVPGDADGDRLVTLYDALFTARAVLGRTSYSETQKKAMDMDGDL